MLLLTTPRVRGPQLHGSAFVQAVERRRQTCMLISAATCCLLNTLTTCFVIAAIG